MKQIICKFEQFIYNESLDESSIGDYQLVNTKDIDIDDYLKHGWVHLNGILPNVTENDYWLATEGKFERSSEDEFNNIDAKVIRSPKSPLSKYKVKDGILYRGSDHWW